MPVALAGACGCPKGVSRFCFFGSSSRASSFSVTAYDASTSAVTAPRPWHRLHAWRCLCSATRAFKAQSRVPECKVVPSFGESAGWHKV